MNDSARSAHFLYRLRQFWRGLWATVAEIDLTVASAVLSPAALTLFRQLPPDGQRHSLNVLASVQASGPQDPDLAVAALLHDVGKIATDQAGIRLTLWWRGPLVLLTACAPGLIARWAAPEPTAGWRYLLYVHQHHPAIGAAMAASAGCSAQACWLVEHHQTSAPPGATAHQLALLRRLQAADDQN